jgi:hypothetical protein
MYLNMLIIILIVFKSYLNIINQVYIQFILNIFIINHFNNEHFKISEKFDNGKK